MFGGHAAIDSTPGRGTRIVVDLPLVERTSDEPSPLSAEPSAADFNG